MLFLAWLPVSWFGSESSVGCAGVHAPEYLPSEEYEGTKAFSEAETRITRDVAKGLAPGARALHNKDTYI